jgi:hypothetical protein
MLFLQWFIWVYSAKSLVSYLNLPKLTVVEFIEVEIGFGELLFMNGDVLEQLPILRSS